MLVAQSKIGGKMNKRKTFKLITIMSLLYLCSCSSIGLKDLNKTKDEVIVIGKMTIKNNDQILNKKWNLLFDERITGKYGIYPDKEGFVFMKLPLGNHFISLLSFYPNNINLPDNYISVNFNESGIYYIGDITFHWDLTNGYSTDGGLIGAITDSKNSGIAINIEIENNLEKTAEVFNNQFQNNENIKTSLMKLDNELHKKVLMKEKNELAKLHKIKLKNGASLSGEIVSLKKETLYVFHKSVLYKLNYKDVQSIIKNDIEISLELEEFKNQKINYNKYSKIEEFLK